MGNQWLKVFLEKLDALVEKCDLLGLEIDFTNIAEYPMSNNVEARIIFNHEREKET